MGLIASLTEFRSNPENPRTSLSAPAPWLYEAFGVSNTASGESVNATTAMRSTAVYACVNILAQGIASLPWDVYVKEKGKRQVAENRREHYLFHNEPNPEMTSYAFRTMLMSSCLLRGNFYAEIQRDNANRTVAIYPIPAESVKVVNGSNRGELYYEVQYERGPKRLKATDVVHVPCLSLDGISGLTPIEQAKQAIGLGMAAEKTGAALFGNGAKPSGALVSDQPLNAQQVDGLKKLWAEFSGAANAGKTPILYGGLKWTPFTMNFDDAQFMELRSFQVADIARIFRVPGVLLGLDDKTSTYASAEQFFLSFVVHTLTPWMTAIEQEFNRKLFPGKTDIYCKLDPRGMMRGDAAGRAEFYNKLFNVGAVSPNDIRELEDMNPVDGGDIYLVPMNMSTLENAGKVQEPKPQQEDPAARLLDRVMKCERQIGAINSRLPKEQQ